MTTHRGGRSERTGPREGFLLPSGRGLVHDGHGERTAGTQRRALGPALHPAGDRQAHSLAVPLGLSQSLAHMRTSHGFWDELHLSSPVLTRGVRA